MKMAILFRRHGRRRGGEAAQAWARTMNSTREQMIRGRRFLAGVPYVLPKDNQEINRLDFQHYVLRQTLGSNTLAPLGKGTKSIADIGCGTARWCHEVAREYPHAHVYGIDLEYTPVPNMDAPPNYTFVPANILNGLPFTDGTFDYIHQRLLVAAIPAASWPAVIRELMRVARPGGWLELLEGGVTCPQAGPATQRLLAWCLEATGARGLDPTLMAYLGSLLEESGLQGVKVNQIDVPLGNWGGRVGTLMAQNMQSAFTSLHPFISEHLPINPDEFTATVQSLPAEWEQLHTLYRFYSAYGQVPAP